MFFVLRSGLIIFFIANNLCFAAIDVPAVVVKKPKILANVQSNGPKKIITRDEISAQGVSSLSQALQSLGGVQLQDTTGNGSQVLLSMRGFGSNATSNTLFMVNGIPITNPDMAPPDLNAIPVQEIEYIEITAGSESVLYGDQAVGGIINVVTRQTFNRQLILSCALGSFDQKNCYAAFSHHYKNVSGGLGILSNATNNYRDHNHYNQRLLSGQIDSPYATGDIEFDFKIANEKMLYPGALTADEVEDDRRQSNNNTDFFSDDNSFYHAKHQQHLNDQWRIETDLMYRDLAGHGVLTFPFTQNRTIDYIKPQVIGAIAKTTVKMGIEAEGDQYNLHTDFGQTDDTLQKYSLFMLVNTPLSEKLMLAMGARGAEQRNQLESNTDTNSLNRALATTLGVTMQFSPIFKGYVREAGSFRFPKADENASTAPGVAGLKTQRGIAYEAGLHFLQKQYEATISLFQLNLRDEITFDPTQTPEDPFGTNRNYAPTKRYGISLAENVALTDKLSVGSQYNYVNARFQRGVNAGNRIPLVSENIIHLGVNYQLLEHVNLYTEALLTGNQYPANDDANVLPSIGGYTTYNINCRYVYRQFTASMRINNIFNKYYYFYTVYQPVMPFETFYPAPGINGLLSLKYVFE